MKNFGILFSSVFFVILIGILKQSHSQPPPRNSYSTGIVESDSFDVKNISFGRRHESGGKGEVLQVIFEVHNKISKSMDLKFFVIGFHEKNSVDPIQRRRIKYPKWRERDFDKEDLNIVLLDSIPRINKVKIDPDIDPENEFVFPSFISYVQHLDKNPATGIPFKLYGLGSTVVTEPVKETRYQIVSVRFKTSVTTLLFSQYKPGFEFFNYIGIVIYDSQNKTAFRHFYQLKHKIRVR